MGLKGEMTIELTNVKTGEVERVHEHNLVTNAASDIINFIANYCGDHDMPEDSISIHNRSMWRRWKISESGYGDITPIITYLLGGIMIFDGAVEESADHVKPPTPHEGVYNIGYANREINTTTDPRRGSLNTSESGSITNGYRFVWDFSTHQANGDIGSVCMVPDECGASGMRRDTYTVTQQYFFRKYREYRYSDYYDRYTYYEYTTREISLDNQTGNPENPATMITDLNCIYPLDYDMETHTFYCATTEIYDSTLWLKTFTVKSTFDKVRLRQRHGLYPYIDDVKTYEVCSCTTSDGMFDGLSNIKIIKENNKFYLTMFQPMTAPVRSSGYYPNDLGKSSLTIAIVDETTGLVEKCQRKNDLECWSAPFAVFKVDDDYIYANGITGVTNTANTSSRYYYMPYVMKISIDTLEIVERAFFYNDDAKTSMFSHQSNYSSYYISSALAATNNPYIEIYDNFFIKFQGYHYTYTTTTDSYYWTFSYDTRSIFYIDKDGSMQGRASWAVMNNPVGDNSATRPWHVFNNAKSKTVGGCFQMVLHTMDSTNEYSKATNRLCASALLIQPFLMTINNLSTPVTKTADKTMKITYTIREVDE